MAQHITVQDCSKFKSYTAVQLDCHVLALRINTNSTCDLLVSDYTSSPDIVSDRVKLPAIGRLSLRPDEFFNLSILLNLLTHLSQEYQHSYNEELFDKKDAHLSQSNWIDVAHRFVFARVLVKLQKKASHWAGIVQRAALLQYDEQFVHFWKRCIERIGPLMAEHPGLLLLVMNYLGKEALSMAADIVPLLSASSTSYSTNESQIPVKIEHESDSEPSQPPPSQPAQQLDSPSQQHSPTQFLTQLLQDSQSQMSFSDSQDPKDIYTLSELNRVPLEANNRIYRTRAVVVGMPDLACVCAKRFQQENGELALSDPHIVPLELVLADSDQKTLSRQNSLTACVPRDQVGFFFGCLFTEQLFTQLGEIQERFRRRSAKAIDLELTICDVDGVKVWVPRNMKFAQIC